jgi:predicted RNase H-like nuclease (RuvC/YqgF family)
MINFASLKTNEDKVRVLQRMEEQVKILNQYIRQLAKENEILQDKNQDMRTTLSQNKQLLGKFNRLTLIQMTTLITSVRAIN